MLPAIVLFGATDVPMLTFSKYRTYTALASGIVINALAALLANLGCDPTPLYFGLLSDTTLSAIIPAYIYIWLVYGVR